MQVATERNIRTSFLQELTLRRDCPRQTLRSAFTISPHNPWLRSLSLSRLRTDSEADDVISAPFKLAKLWSSNGLVSTDLSRMLALEFSLSLVNLIRLNLTQRANYWCGLGMLSRTLDQLFVSRTLLSHLDMYIEIVHWYADTECLTIFSNFRVDGANTNLIKFRASRLVATQVWSA
jgi:hypothetical protein